jgi:ubiquinone/menaquinone biosynthesis C-methylase UbiE
MREEQKTRVREQFGVSADEYAKSEVHARGESLSLLINFIKPRKEWQALDVATGAGHTAMAIAPLVTRMVAMDITREMTLKASWLAASRGIKNMDTSLADAESLPFKDASFDLVTCRIAMHHFGDARAAIREASRVLKEGGIFALDDNVVTEGGPVEEQYNAFEKIRDPSHNRVYTLPELQSMLEEERLRVVKNGGVTAEVEFNEWADRQHVSGPDKKRLMDMLHDAPLSSMLMPRFTGDTAYFILREAVLIAKK